MTRAVSKLSKITCSVEKFTVAAKRAILKRMSDLTGRISESENEKEWTLEKDTELRFEVKAEDGGILVLQSGQAEIFGTELVKNRRYKFPAGSKAAVFTWHGCVVKVVGELEMAYVSTETPMLVYINAHMALEKLRQKAEKSTDKEVGPRLLVCGPGDVGKSTFCRMMANYAVRQGRTPIYIDLDVGQNSLSVPGTMAASVIERPCDIEEGFSVQNPLVYHFGHNSPGPNVKLYNNVVSTLSEFVHKRFEKDDKARTSGFIVNTCGWVTGAGLKILIHAVEALKVDVIAVIDQERVFMELDSRFKNSVKIVQIPKSGGVVERSSTYRRHLREEKIREYFYGGATQLYPDAFDVGFDEVKIYKIGAPSVPDSCLPIGMQQEDNDLKVMAMSPSKDMLHCVCAISMADQPSDNLATTNVAGFVVITNIDTSNRMLTLLSPTHRPLPRNKLLLSTVQFIDLK